MTFKEKVFSVVKKIPRGKILTYGEVARRAGSPRASRAVGSILKTNYSKDIPCHRVIRSDGKRFLQKASKGVGKTVVFPWRRTAKRQEPRVPEIKRLSLFMGDFNRGRIQKIALLRAEKAIV